MSNILVIDDFKRDQEMLAGPFQGKHDVRCAGDLAEAGRLLEKWWPDVALVDAIFPKTRYAPPGFLVGAFLDMVEEASPSYAGRPQVIIVSGQNDAARRFEDVRSWLHDGRIADVIPKATADIGVEFFRAVVQLRVESLLERRKWRTVQSTAESAAEWFRRFGILTRSPKILALRRDLQAAARSDLCVLLDGAHGTGKQLFAEAIHALTRDGKPFTHLNCATVPPLLFASEMFGIKGHSKDGTYYPKPGLLDATAQGTLFLDDIQKLAYDHQTQLNQVLQERKYIRVGGTATEPVRARIICATNKDLQAMSEEGMFMEDLYYRIKGFHIQVPKLSERVEDIPPLAESFLADYVNQRKQAGDPCPVMRLHPKCFDMLCGYAWKGNVRELKHLIERVAAYAAGEEVSELEIGAELLLKMEPNLAVSVSPSTTFDEVLAGARAGAARWADLTEEDLCKSIRALLSKPARDQFEKMLLALRLRPRDAAPETSGRDSQDPATVHCLKVLLYLLLCPGNRVSVQEILDLLHVRAWATGKKVMAVLNGDPQAHPPFGAFLALPSPGSRQVAALLPGMLALSQTNCERASSP